MNYCKDHLNAHDAEMLENIIKNHENDFTVLDLVRRYAFEVQIDFYIKNEEGWDMEEYFDLDHLKLTDFEKIMLKDIERSYDDAELTTLIELYKKERSKDYLLEDKHKFYIRRCDYCGKPMAEGWVLGDYEHACSYTCAANLYSGNADEQIAQFEEELEDAEEPDGETYYTEWEDFFIQW